MLQQPERRENSAQSHQEPQLEDDGRNTMELIAPPNHTVTAWNIRLA